MIVARIIGPVFLFIVWAILNWSSNSADGDRGHPKAHS